MIREQELREAIAECQGERNPNANTCIKLAAYYSILDHMEPQDMGASFLPAIPQGYSYEAQPPEPEMVELDGESEFAQEINGLPVTEVMPIIDELMETVRILHPRLYDGVMRKIRKEI